MNTVPKISIVAPVYNVERYLKECIESLLNQTFKDIEVILVNDGSTDSSGIICGEYALKDKRVKVIHQNNQGVSFARKKGTLEAKGEFLMYIDSDDWLDLNTCKITYEKAIQENADVIIFSYYRVYNNNLLRVKIFENDKSFIGKEVKDLQRRVVGLIDEELKDPQKFDSLTSMYMRLIKRTLITENKIDFIDTRIMFPGEDTIFNIELFQFSNRVFYINNPFYYYRREISSSATGTINISYFDKWIGHLIFIRNYILENNLGNLYLTALENRICCEFIGITMKETNPINPRTFFQRLSFLKSVLNHELYKESFKKLKTKYMPLHWKIFFICCKMRFGLPIYIMGKSMRFLRSRVEI